ncbi:biopolymer transport protein ExbD [Roseicyclus mahoneyensis]|uniref:Biopolymer transport protein ExbD n=2 Tax=Roseicyclus mahoneyensis TaxID=164332 RepID=A0A316GL66_9RHOB|nr:biopolymer transport protein ExbD [Roseicyclus mahoneyensis]
MIDVVFLLLVFFMLAARFGQEGALELRIAASGGAEWQGPPRLVRIEPEGFRLNGQITDLDGLIETLSRLTDTGSDLILVQPAEGVDLQRLMDGMGLLERAGFTTLALVSP